MAKKNKQDWHKDFSSALDETKKRLKQFGDDMGVWAKKGEKEIVKASKAGKAQMDILGLNVKKEKLYYDLGKKVVALNAKKKLGIPELESFWKKLRELQKDARKRKQELHVITRTGTKRKSK